MIDPDRIGIDSFLLEGIPETAPERNVRLTNNQITSYLDNLQGGRLGTSDTFCVGKLTVQTSWIRLLRQTTKRINLYWQ
jgi:hypothetical protein